MKRCKECGIEYERSIMRGFQTYCSNGCRKIVRARVNYAQKQKRKQLILEGNGLYIGTEVFKTYKRRAYVKGMEFDLTLEYFVNNVKSQCYYCGDTMVKIGFDRLNNSVGYLENNTVPCCTICNFMKRNTSIEDFVHKCRQISNNFK